MEAPNSSSSSSIGSSLLIRSTPLAAQYKAAASDRICSLSVGTLFVLGEKLPVLPLKKFL